MPTNFWSFVYVIVKGSWAKVGSDISTSLEMTCLQSWSIDFFLFLFSEIEEKNHSYIAGENLYTTTIWENIPDLDEYSLRLFVYCGGSGIFPIVGNIPDPPQ